MMGTLVGASRMILDFVYEEPMCGEEDTRPAILADVPLHVLCHTAVLAHCVCGDRG